MKQHTTPDQTAKLIELGFEKPSSIASVEPIYGMGGISVAKAYSIGELFEMLPTSVEIGDGYAVSIYHNRSEWMVSYDDNGIYLPLYSTEKDELIDALYDMIIKLKEERVI